MATGGERVGEKEGGGGEREAKRRAGRLKRRTRNKCMKKEVQVSAGCLVSRGRVSPLEKTVFGICSTGKLCIEGGVDRLALF